MLGAGACAAKKQSTILRGCGVPPKGVMAADKTEEGLIRQPRQQLVLGEQAVAV